MKVLVTGPLRGDTDRLKGLKEVSEAELVFVIGPLDLKAPFKLGSPWFYVRGASDNLKVLSKSDGVDLMSRIFNYKRKVFFSGLSGVYHPSTERFTRQEWIKVRGKIDRRKQNYLFKEDYDLILQFFRRSGIARLDILLLAESPDNPAFKEILEMTKPKYVFFPSKEYSKRVVGDTIFVGLEPVSSPKGKYIINLGN